MPELEIVPWVLSSKTGEEFLKEAEKLIDISKSNKENMRVRSLIRIPCYVFTLDHRIYIRVQLRTCFARMKQNRFFPKKIEFDNSFDVTKLPSKNRNTP